MLGRNNELGHRAPFGRRILLAVVLVIGSDFLLGRFGLVAKGVDPKGCIADRAAFGAHIVAALFLIKSVQRLGSRLSSWRVGCAGQHRDRAAAGFLEQCGVLRRKAVRHLGAESGGNQQLLGEQALCHLCTHTRFGNVLACKALAECLLVEIAIGSLECRVAQYLAVHQVLARTQPVLRRKTRQGTPFDQAVQHIVKAALLDKGGSRNSRILPLDIANGSVRRIEQFGSVDLFAPDHGDRLSTAEDAERSTIRDVAHGESESDQGHKAEGDRNTELRFEEIAEKLHETCRSESFGSAAVRLHQERRFIRPATSPQQLPLCFDLRVKSS